LTVDTKTTEDVQRPGGAQPLPGLFVSRRGKALVTISPRFVPVLVAVALVIPAPPAAAQPPSGPVTAGWQDGFVIQSANGDYRLNLGMVVQADGRFVTSDDAGDFDNTFTIRKLRPMFTGRMARYFDFSVVPDFGGGVAVLQDGYIDARFSSAFRVRAGKSKAPIGYEILISDPFLLFPERSLASNLVPNRDVGVLALGELGGGRISYAGGIINGIPDGTSSTADADSSDSKDLAGRFVVQPFRRAANPGSLNGLGFALGASHGRQEGALPSFRTAIGQRYFTYAPGTAADGDRTRVTPAFFLYSGSFGVFGEYVRSTQSVRSGAAVTAVTNDAWDITGSFVLTGEPGADRGVRPRAAFDPEAGTWGALQIVARYSALSLDRSAFAAGLAAPGAAAGAEAFAVGANWYPAAFLKYYIAYEHTVFDDLAGGERPAEDAVIFRAQLAF
jgi:phosphate-selective porin OprO/OprP